MIFSGKGWVLLERNVEKRDSVQRTPVEFFVFMPLQDKRGGVTVQVTPLVLRNGELVAAVGKLDRVVDDDGMTRVPA